MIPSESFEIALRNFDSLLSIRPGRFNPGWVIERKAWMPAFELEYLKRKAARMLRFAANKPSQADRYMKIHRNVAEEFESGRNGKRVVLITTVLDQRVFDSLALADTQRYGGYSRFLDELERKEKEVELQRERDLARMRDELHSEAFDKLNFAFRKKENELMHYDGRQKLSELIR